MSDGKTLQDLSLRRKTLTLTVCRRYYSMYSYQPIVNFTSLSVVA